MEMGDPDDRKKIVGVIYANMDTGEGHIMMCPDMAEEHPLVEADIMQCVLGDAEKLYEQSLEKMRFSFDQKRQKKTPDSTQGENKSGATVGENSCLHELNKLIPDPMYQVRSGKNIISNR